MPDLTDRAWLVLGELDLGRTKARLATTFPGLRLVGYDFSAPGEEFSGAQAGACWGELVRAETEAAVIDITGAPARVALAKLGRRHHLAVVITRGGLDPRAVLGCVLADEPVGVAAEPQPPQIPEVDLPGLRTGQPSGSASTLIRPCADVDEPTLAAAVAILLARYRSQPNAHLLVSGRLVPVTVNENEPAGALVRRIRNTTGIPVPPGISTSVAVTRHHKAKPEAVGPFVITPVEVADGRARHELAISLTPERTLRIDYDAGLFETPDVFAFANRLRHVIDEIVADRPVVEITALTDEETAAVAEWSRGDRQELPDTCLHTVVERHDPQALAVVCGDAKLTYGELNDRADAVANALAEQGIGRHDVVAIMAERRVESIVAMLGVLKSGAAYVPIEPSYPEERIRHIIEDSGARAVLTGDETGIPGHRPRHVDPADTAYLIYTSGSTGVPKGVAVSHRSIVVSTHARGVGGPPPKKDLVTMPLCFDGAAGGLYWTLTGGGTVVLPTEIEAHDLLALRSLLLRHRVTHIHSVPSHYGLVLQAAGGSGLEDLKLVSVGGEPMPPKLVARHLFDCPDAVLLNDYGPTEAAVWATAHRCDFADATGAKIPIGGPLPNYRIHVLDAHLRPVPPGLPGEIYIGGPAVARGYHRRPQLTAERFLPDPFGNGRLYRTGDRGQWSAQGELYILGRVDNQVKLRGFRVELGEIEAAVRQHKGVADCVVQVRETRVLAFVASHAGVTEAELRGEVARLLPAYMHPDRFIVLPELPRSPSGKLDLQRLRAYEVDLAAVS
ncbi:AMP-binding protein [Lentzea sp. NBRC 105346]|uniref:amino acid adenylation domain-containing protein n=1 Tax=Lentzea sp. NBRC 105346 TaxID=3032205 RepID=UPI00255776EE|nr:AMP-binding protein [Lentzea sp. NBRC 105346]